MTKEFKLYIVTALIIMAALSCAHVAHADKDFSLSVESKEIIYDPQTQMAYSLLKSLTHTGRFDLKADRLQIDFNNNVLRASGNVLLYSDHSNMSLLPLRNDLEADFNNYFTGRDVVIDLEAGEAMIYPDDMKARPVTIDLNFSRVVPPLKRIGELPKYVTPPDEDVLLCFSLSYTTTGKFTLRDVTFLPAGQPQYYSALVVSDAPDLKYNAYVFKSVNARKSYETNADGENEDTPRFWYDSTLWIDDKPRHATYADVSAHVSEREGFEHLSASLTQTISFSNFGASASIEGNEHSKAGAVAVKTYTPSRNSFSFDYGRTIYDAGNELLPTSNTREVRRLTSGQLELWDENYRIKAGYVDYDAGDGYFRLTPGSSATTRSEEDVDARMSTSEFTLDPIPTFIRGYRFAMTAAMSRLSYNDRDLAASTADYFDNYGRENVGSVTTTLMSGILNLNNRAFIVQDINYTAEYHSDRNSSVGITGGAVISDTGTMKSHYNNYDFTANTRLLLPLSHRALLSFRHEFEEKSDGSSTDGSSAFLTPGLTYTWNRQDYAFVGVIYDFAAEEWTTLNADLVLRRNHDLQAFASLNYHLVNDASLSKTFGLAFDVFGGTLAASYEDLDSDFRVAFYTRGNVGMHRGSLLDKVKDY